MELKELRHFVRVARAGSFSRAASELRIAQPALSRQIGKLEHELGLPLFVRHGRGVRLTTAGSMLLERAETIAQLVHQAGKDIRDERSPAGGRIVLGVPPAAGRLLVAPAVERFRALWPQLSVQFREGVTSTLQDWVLEKEIDIALLHNSPPLDALEIAPVLTERMFVVGPASGQHSRTAKRTYRIKDFGELPLILPSLAHNNRRLVEQVALENGVRLRIRIEADSVAFAKALVQAGHGCTILTYAAVQDEVARRKLVAYPIARPSLFTKVAVVVRRDRQHLRLIHDAAEVLKQAMRDLVQGKQWPGAQLSEE